MSEVNLGKYEIITPLCDWDGKPIAELHFNAITYAAHAILPDSFLMEMKKDEKIDDFIVRVGQRAQFNLGMSFNEFEDKHEKINLLFEADEAQRIAGEKQADSRGEAIWDHPPHRKGQGRPKFAHQAEASLPGTVPGGPEPMGEGPGEEEGGDDGRFAIFDGTY